MFRTNRIEREKMTVGAMIALYCKGVHRSSAGALCAECRELLSYACTRLDRCPFGEQKPACSGCSVHCYKAKKDLRQEIKAAMRYAGPRMLFRHPILALLHEWDKRTKSGDLETLRNRKQCAANNSETPD